MRERESMFEIIRMENKQISPKEENLEEIE
jgi:hypothetical protein